jgi:phospholipid-binding lipoprotein MlaA
MLITVAALAGAGAAHAQSDPTDPWEPMNRRFFAFQETIDIHVLEPIARSFGQTPSPLRVGLLNFARNLGEPLVFANDVLQARPARAAATLGRFIVNSTVGLAGFVDIAKKNHMPHHDNGFGTTMGRWGAKPGPYLFLPFIGPSTFRDALGGAADFGLNPLTYARYPHKTAIGIATSVLDGLGQRVDADQSLSNIRQTSTDPYATVRSYYLQNRAAEISGKPVTIETLPDFDEPAPAKPAAPAGPAATPPPPSAGEPIEPKSQAAAETAAPFVLAASAPICRRVGTP